MNELLERMARNRAYWDDFARQFFGLNWTVDEIRPWILDTIEFFRPDRCMFASHMPIAKLACSFQNFYRAYLDVVSDFSASEKRKLFHDTATVVYGLASPDRSQQEGSHIGRLG